MQQVAVFAKYVNYNIKLGTMNIIRRMTFKKDLTKERMFCL